MNARTIKSQMKKAGFNLGEWRIEKGYKCYNVWLLDYGLSDNERQQMTSDEVIAKRQGDKDKVKELAELFKPETCSVLAGGGVVIR